MMNCLHKSIWRISPLVPRRGLSSAASPVQSSAPIEIFRTNESDPARHTEEHEAQFYSIPPAQVRSVFPHGLPSRFQLQCKTLRETCVMVRRPALEIINYLRKTNFTQPVLRYVLYGKNGTGKTLTLCHVLHYCHSQGWLVVHLPDAHLLVKECKEVLGSSYRTGRYDQPLEASNWLKHFKASNDRFLSQMVTGRRYVWSKREVTEEGAPLSAVVDQGLTRVKSACDVVGVVLKELKRRSGGGGAPILISMDGANSLWGRTSLRKGKSIISPEELTLVHNFRKMVKNDWSGGAVVMTVSQTGSLYHPKSDYLPRALLGKEGFDFLDPFIPVLVPQYSQKEFDSCYQYYRQRGWIQHDTARSEEGKAELMFLSHYNPREMEKICAFL